MRVGPFPLIAVGMLSGTLPTGAGARTLAAAPMASGSSQPVGLSQSNAVTGLTLDAFSMPQASPDVPSNSFEQQLLLTQSEDE